MIINNKEKQQNLFKFYCVSQIAKMYQTPSSELCQLQTLASCGLLWRRYNLHVAEIWQTGVDRPNASFHTAFRPHERVWRGPDLGCNSFCYLGFIGQKSLESLLNVAHWRLTHISKLASSSETGQSQPALSGFYNLTSPSFNTLILHLTCEEKHVGLKPARL